MNVARAYGLLPGEPRTPERQVVVEAFAPVRPTRGGFVHHAVALYDFVTAGQTVGTVHTVFGEPLETLAAPADGVVWSMSVYPMAATGETVLTLGINPQMTDAQDSARE